jgi:putative ABC transport system substrate-binding protein
MAISPHRTRVQGARRLVPAAGSGAGPSAAVWRMALGASLIVAALPGFTGCTSADTDAADASTVKRVGLMHVGRDHVPPSLEGLKDGLAELGWKEGKNVHLIWRNLDKNLAAAQARAFVLDRVDVIVAFEDKSIEEAQKATDRDGDRIPIVFLHPSDPVRDGLVKSLDRPGGNLTGVFGARDVVAKQLEIYERLVPRLHRVLTLIDPDDAARTDRLLKEYKSAAAHLQRPLELDIRKASSADDLKRIFRSLRPAEVDGAFLLSPSLRLNYSSLTIRLAREARLPVQAHRKEWVEKGALYSYGSDLYPIGRAAARYVDSILKGKRPSELGVEEISDVEFAINLKTASSLGIKVPQGMIIEADEVYR